MGGKEPVHVGEDVLQPAFRLGPVMKEREGRAEHSWGAIDVGMAAKRFARHRRLYRKGMKLAGTSSEGICNLAAFFRMQFVPQIVQTGGQ